MEAYHGDADVELFLVLLSSGCTSSYPQVQTPTVVPITAVVTTIPTATPIAVPFSNALALNQYVSFGAGNVSAGKRYNCMNFALPPPGLHLPGTVPGSRSRRPNPGIYTPAIILRSQSPATSSCSFMYGLQIP
ncbi:MAG: hypothetical protein WCF90_00820 [Methanomicrobiales archaeon]